MTAKQTVYLSSDRTQAVPAGDKDAKFLLVREGHEIEPAVAEQYDGAVDLIGSKPTAKAAKAAEIVQAPVPGADTSVSQKKAAAAPNKKKAKATK